VRLGFLASHRGSDVQAVVDACATGRLAAVPRLIVSNNADAEVLVRARAAGIATCHLSSVTHPDPDRLDGAILDALLAHDVELVIMAGYLRKLGPRTLRHFAGRVLNIHPALLPKFGGRGMYGRRVHEAVLAAGERETGVTIHLADEEYDQGRMVAQCRVAVRSDDTVESLAARVLEREHSFLVETLARIVSGEVRLS
jgi:phosphoribosylglycinamide formyltransferase-1